MIEKKIKLVNGCKVVKEYIDGNLIHKFRYNMEDKLVAKRYYDNNVLVREECYTDDKLESVNNYLNGKSHGINLLYSRGRFKSMTIYQKGNLYIRGRMLSTLLEQKYNVEYYRGELFLSQNFNNKHDIFI